MSKENVLHAWKNPVSRDGQNHPAGNVLEELQREEMEVLAGGAWWNISKNWFGNNGKVCTLTKECQESCN